MKKRILTTLFYITMAAFLFPGCSAKTEKIETSESPQLNLSEPMAETPERIQAPEPIQSFVTDTDPSGETAELTTNTEMPTNEFAVDPLIDTIMYATQAVNVRTGPTTEYDKLGTLSFSQEVTVTGIADTGWYQIDFKGSTAYCSNDYLKTEKPKALSAANTSSTSSNGTALIDDFDYAAYEDALARGDYQEALRLANGGSKPSNSSGSTTSETPSLTASTAKEFVDFLNSMRASQGLSSLSWSDDLSATAIERAKEISSDFSHSGQRNCHGEIILATSTSDAASWYNSWNDSPAHKSAMLNESCTSAAAAVCKSGSRYYVVCLFRIG